MLLIPRGFVRDGESPEDTVRRVVELETGWTSPDSVEEPFYDGYIYDARQTDHAWVETVAYLLEADPTERVDGSRPGNPFSEIGWWPLEAATVNRIPPVLAGLVRDAVRRLAESGRMDTEDASRLLVATG